MTAFRFANPGAPSTILAVSTALGTLAIPGGAGFGHQTLIHNTGTSDAFLEFFPTSGAAPSSVTAATALQVPAGVLVGPFALGDTPMSVAAVTAAGSTTLRLTPGFDA